MGYFAPIPAQVIELLPMVLKNHQSGMEHPDPFDIRIDAFDGNDGEQMFSIEVHTNAEKITPKDRRQKPYMQACCTTYYFNAAGGFADEPTVYTGRYR